MKLKNIILFLLTLRIVLAQESADVDIFLQIKPTRWQAFIEYTNNHQSFLGIIITISIIIIPIIVYYLTIKIKKYLE